MKLCDAHIHLDDFAMPNASIARSRGKRAGEMHEVHDLERLAQHLASEPLEEAYLIFSSEASFSAAQKRISGVTLKGWYWLRLTEGVRVGEKERSLLERLADDPSVYGLKIHPAEDLFPLDATSMRPVTELARELGFAILFHTDDRRESMHFTDADRYEKLIAENPDIIFVLGHGGAFCHPRLVGERNTAAAAYWSEERGPYSVRTSITRALEIAATHPNAYYETSTCYHPEKARLIGAAVERRHALCEKIVMGTDFPLGMRATVTGQLRALERAGLSAEYIRRIAASRLPQK
ncbi:amidohydrolase family protein [Candidatus Woesearchaeota archaeon]|nr:amidohydrolase family protein [Candidatus Woesearchaeota archaeon]